MSLDLGLLRAWQGAPLTATATRVTTAAVALRAELTTVLAATPDGVAWQGVAAQVAVRRHATLVDEVLRIASVLTELEAAFIRAAGRVQSVGDLARAATDLAERHGVVITESGLVLDPVVPDGGVTPVQQDVDRLVREAQGEADLADAELVAALVAVAARVAVLDPAPPPALAGTAAVATSTAPFGLLTPSGSGAATILVWWSGLSADARRSAIVDAPDLVGQTDGIPAWARDQANRIRLSRAERELTLQADRLQPLPGGGFSDVSRSGAGEATVGTLDGPSRRAAYLQVRDKLAALTVVEQVLDQTDTRDRQLLVLDLTGRSARVAVAVGDVDRAPHLAVVVPGFTTTVQGDLAGSDAVAVALRDVARRESMAWGDHGEVAVVSWLGYDAPQLADTLRSHSVVARASAQAGATDLNPFLRGLPATAHLTLVGHSYGSTTAGLAVAAGGSGVDDFVAIGSPGLGVTSMGALGLPATRVHVIEAAGDPVGDLGWFGRDPGHLAGVDLLSADAAPLTDGSVGLPSHGHSEYLSPGTTSQWNVAAVVAGVSTVPAARARELDVG